MARGQIRPIAIANDISMDEIDPFTGLVLDGISTHMDRSKLRTMTAEEVMSLPEFNPVMDSDDLFAYVSSGTRMPVGGDVLIYELETGKIGTADLIGSYGSKAIADIRSADGRDSARVSVSLSKCAIIKI